MSVTSEHYVLAEDEAEAIWFLGTLATVKAAGARTGGALSVVEFTHPPGFATPRHVHYAEDEAFYILEGAMRGFCGDRSWRATPGSFVWLPRGIPHGFAVDGEAEPLRSLAITLPAGFERFVAEVGEPAPERTLPPPAAPNVEKLLATAAKHGQEILGRQSSGRAIEATLQEEVVRQADGWPRPRLRLIGYNGCNSRVPHAAALTDGAAAW